MSVIRYNDCFQGHPVPKTARRPSGPFPAELFADPEIINEYDRPYEQTPKQEVTWVYCRDCDAKVRSDETEYHDCDEDAE